VDIIRDFWGTQSFRSKPKKKKAMYTLGFKPTFQIGTAPKFAPIPKRPNKDLTYAQGRSLYGPALAPFGNWDKDKHLNMFDCRPFDPTRHKVPEEHKKRKIPSYIKPNRTWEQVWDEAEKDLPQAFKRSQERKYSDLLSNALMGRENTYKKDTPFKDVVGTYKLDKVILDRSQTRLAQRYILDYLACVQPDKHFEFYLEEPSKVRVTDMETGEVRENIKVSRYFPKGTPPHIQNLLTLLTPYAKLTIVISDYPMDIMKKSSIITSTDKDPGGWNLTWNSCETLGRSVMGMNEYGYEVGSFSDIKYGNAIAWFYLGGKTPGKDYPNGRVMLRWGTTTGDWEGEPDIGIEFKADSSNPGGFYGMSGRSARGLIGELQKLLKAKGYFSHSITTPYEYQGYSDVKGSSGRISYRPFSQQVSEQSNKTMGQIKDTMVWQKKLPQPFAFQFARDPNASIREQLARRVTEPDDPHTFDPKLPKQVMMRLAKDKNISVRRYLPQATFSLPPEVTRTLATDSDPEVVKRLSRRSDIPDDVRQQMIETSSELAIEIAQQDNLAPEVRKILMAHPDYHVRAQFASRTDLTQEEMYEIAKDKATTVKLAFIKEQKLPRELWEKFCRDKDPDVRQKMARLKQLPPDLMLQLSKDYDDNVRLAIAGRKLIPDDILISMIYSEGTVYEKYDQILQHIANREELSNEVITALMDIGIQGDYNVLRALQLNEGVPEKTREQLLLRMIQDDSATSDLVEYAINNWYGSVKIMRAVFEWLQKHPDANTVKDKLAKSELLPKTVKNEIFALLFEIGDKRVHELLRRNPTVNVEVKKLIGGNDYGY